MRNGRMDWVGAASAELWSIQFRAYDMWGQGLSGGQLIPHSLHAVQLLADDPISHQIVRWFLNSWNWSKHLRFGSGANSLVLRVNNLTSDILGWDDMLLSGCVYYCQLYALLTCGSSGEVEKQYTHEFHGIQMPIGICAETSPTIQNWEPGWL